EVDGLYDDQCEAVLRDLKLATTYIGRTQLAASYRLPLRGSMGQQEFVAGGIMSQAERLRQQLDIYGPARDVKGASRGKTRLGTDAVIYPTSS
ncbi:MAG TPA: hypothetical protein VH681_05760, partial [Nitrospiraceae bacterium]